MILCGVTGCEVERKAQAFIDELEGKNGRARCNAEFEHSEWCWGCKRTVGFTRKSDGSVRVKIAGEATSA